MWPAWPRLSRQPPKKRSMFLLPTHHRSVLTAATHCRRRRKESLISFSSDFGIQLIATIGSKTPCVVSYCRVGDFLFLLDQSDRAKKGPGAKSALVDRP